MDRRGFLAGLGAALLATSAVTEPLEAFARAPLRDVTQLIWTGTEFKATGPYAELLTARMNAALAVLKKSLWESVMTQGSGAGSGLAELFRE